MPPVAGTPHGRHRHPLVGLARTVALELAIAEIVHRLRRPSGTVSDDAAPRKHHRMRALGRTLLVEALESFAVNVRWQQKRAAAAVEHAAAVQSVTSQQALVAASVPRPRTADHDTRDAVPRARSAT